MRIVRALSVAMTSVSTLLAPFLTPLLVLAMAGQFLPVDAAGLFFSIVKIVLAPVLLGLLLRKVIPGTMSAASTCCR